MRPVKMEDSSVEGVPLKIMDSNKDALSFKKRASYEEFPVTIEDSNQSFFKGFLCFFNAFLRDSYAF